MSRKTRKIRISVDEPVKLPVGVVHTGTTYWLSRTKDFINALVHDENDEVALREKRFVIDLADDEPLYVKTQYVYNGGLDAEPAGSLSTESRISSLRGDQRGLHISDAIVNTPKLELLIDSKNNSIGELTLKSSDFKMFTSVGNHLATTWILKDLNNTVLYKREKDSDNLTSITLPSSMTIDTNFIAEVYYHTDTNVISNAGHFYNLKPNRKSTVFTVTKMGRLITTRPQYFKINLKTVRFKSYRLIVRNGNKSIIYNQSGLTDLSVKVSTIDFIAGENYSFEFVLDLGTEYSESVIINDIASDISILYNPNKDYLDQYDFKHLIQTRGKTTQLSYQLHNDTILLTRSGDKSIGTYKYSNGNLMRIGDGLTLPVTKDIFMPSLYVQEMHNGDICIAYVSRDTSVNNLFIGVYDFNPITNTISLKHSKNISSKDNLIHTGGITVTWDNKIHYITYDNGVILNSLDIYADNLEVIPTPINVAGSVSIVRNNFDDIVLLGGTNTDDNINQTVFGVRDNHKVFVYDSQLGTFSEVGTDIMLDINTDLFSFHSVLRHDGKIALFNTLDNGNLDGIDNQSTIIIDLDLHTATLLTNDHLDDLSYLGTIVLNSGDVLRFSSNVKDPQKLYAYVSDSTDGGRLDDNDNIVRVNNELIVLEGEVITVDNLSLYDTVIVRGNGVLNYVTDDGTLTFDSTHLILTRDTVLYRSEFNAGQWSDVVLIGARLIIKDTDDGDF